MIVIQIFKVKKYFFWGCALDGPGHSLIRYVICGAALTEATRRKHVFEYGMGMRIFFCPCKGIEIFTWIQTGYIDVLLLLISTDFVLGGSLTLWVLLVALKVTSEFPIEQTGTYRAVENKIIQQRWEDNLGLVVDH